MKGKVSVNLATLDSGNTSRDNRVLEHFFEAKTEDTKGKKSNKMVSFSIDKIEEVGQTTLKKIDEPITFKAKGTLKIHGTEKKQRFFLRATRTDSNSIRVQTAKPYAFSIEDFGMNKPLEKLMEVCGHQSISDAVPVHLSIAFDKSGDSKN